MMEKRKGPVDEAGRREERGINIAELGIHFS